MQTALPGASSLPQNIPIVKTYDRIQKAFPGGSEPAYVGIQARDVRAPQIQRAVAELIGEASRTKGLLHPITVQQSNDHQAETVSIPLAGDGTNATSDAALARLRALVPQTVGAVHGVQAGVTGNTAGTVDFDATMNSHLPIVFAFVLGAAFLLLLFTFRSIVIPLQAIALNLLSVAAAYGLLVLVFQHGVGHSCSASRARARSPRGCRSSYSWCCSGCRWTTTCSSSAAFARPSTAASRPRGRRPGGFAAPPAWSPAPRW